MWLYLVRHGDAASRADWTEDDAARPLTEQGRMEVGAAARGLAALDLKAEMILTSPRLRAEQTAHLIAEELRLPVTTREMLGGGFDLAALASLLDEFASARGVMLVGHEPDFSELAGMLCGDEQAPSQIHMRKGACCALKLAKSAVEDPGHHGAKLVGAATLEWLLTAPQLGLIGATPPQSDQGASTDSDTPRQVGTV